MGSDLSVKDSIKSIASIGSSLFIFFCFLPQEKTKKDKIITDMKKRINCFFAK
jgi:hypothetical protein